MTEKGLVLSGNGSEVHVPLGVPAQYVGGKVIEAHVEGRPVRLAVERLGWKQGRLAHDLADTLAGRRAALRGEDYTVPWEFVAALLPLGIPLLTLGGLVWILVAVLLTGAGFGLAYLKKPSRALRLRAAFALAAAGYGAGLLAVAAGPGAAAAPAVGPQANEVQEGDIATATWREFAPADGHFAVSLPADPHAQPALFAGNVPGKRYRVAYGTPPQVKFVVDHAEAPKGKADWQALAELAHMLNPTPFPPQFTRKRHFFLADHPAWDYERDPLPDIGKARPGPWPKDDYCVRQRLIVVGTRLYSLTLSALRVEDLRAYGPRFFDSFRPINPPPPVDVPETFEDDDVGRDPATPPAPKRDRSGRLAFRCGRTLGFTPDGKTLVTGEQKTVTLWDLAGKAAPRRFTITTAARQNEWVTGAAFLPDGKMLVFKREGGDRLDLSTGDIRAWNDLDLQLPRDRYIAGGAVTPDGALLAVAVNGYSTGIWDLPNRKALPRIRGGDRHLALAPDGKTLALRDVFSMSVWDLASGEEIRLPDVNLQTGKDGLQLTRDGRLLAASCGDKRVRVWDLAKRELRANLPHGSEIIALALSPDGKLLVSAGGPLKFWDVERRLLLAEIKPPAWVVGLTFVPDGKQLLVATQTRVTLWNLADLKLDPAAGVAVELPPGTFRVVPNIDHAVDLAFTPDGKSLLVGHYDRGVRLWDPVQGVEQAAVKSKRKLPPRLDTAFAFAPEKKMALSLGTTPRPWLWDLEHFKLGVLFRKDEAVNPQAALALSPDRRTLAVSGDGDTITLWSVAVEKVDTLEAGKVERTLAGRGSAFALAYAPDGKALAAGTIAGDVVIHNLAGGGLTVLERPEDLKGPVRKVAYAPDGKTLAAVDDKQTVYLWDVGHAAARAALRHESAPKCVAFAPSGALLAVGLADGSVQLWDRAGKRRERLTPPHGQEEAKGLAFVPDGSALAVARGGEVHFWDLARLRGKGP